MCVCSSRWKPFLALGVFDGQNSIEAFIICGSFAPFLNIIYCKVENCVRDFEFVVLLLLCNLSKVLVCRFLP